MKEINLTIWVHDDVNPHIISDSINDLLRSPSVYPMIADDDDEGWSWYCD